MSSGKLTFLHEPNEKETPAFRKRRRSHPSEDAAPTATSFAEIVSDNFRIRHPPPQHANELKLIQQEAIVVPIRSLIIFAITVALSVGLWVTPAYAQDPAVVNSKTIRVRFENDRVRVLEAILPPGTKEQVHSHPAYIIYVLAGGSVSQLRSRWQDHGGHVPNGRHYLSRPFDPCRGEHWR